MTHWLVRRQNLTFSRPIPQRDLIKKIEAGELRADDEICASFGHWFSLQEASEVRANLGDVKLERLYAQAKDEVTSETATATILEKTTALQQSAPVQPSWATVAAPRFESPGDHAEPQTVLKGAIFVFLFFSAFILLLISFWLSTY